jgi:HlyD family secretion protein
VSNTSSVQSSQQDSQQENQQPNQQDRQLPPKKLRWLRWKWLRFGLPIMLLLGTSGRLNFLPVGNRSQPNLLTQSVERKTVPIRITANGTVDAERSINLSPKSAGVIKALYVKEGDRVRRGQVVAVMDDSNLRGELTQMQGQLAQQEANLQRLIAGDRPENIAQAEAQLAEAEANLQQLRAGNRPQEIAQASASLQEAQATLRQRQADWQRYQQLSQEGAISQQDLDLKQMDRDVAQKQVTQAAQALALQKAGTRPEQIAQAEAQVAQQAQAVALLKAGSRAEDVQEARAQVQAAKGALQTVQAQVNDTQVVAPFDGTVITKYADAGAFVSPSMVGGGDSASSSSILTLSSNRLQVVVNLSESQIAKVKLGQAVTIQADAFPGESLMGKVSQIAPKATVSQNVTSFEVRVAITSPSEKLRAGMNVEAQFEIGRLENALLVPNAAVVRQAEGTGVYVLERNKPVFQPIQTGATAGSQTEVKSGLQGDEQVLLSPPKQSDPSPSGLSLPKAPPQ